MRDVAPWVERMARVGYVSKALLYITVGTVAARAAFGPSSGATDTHGALRLVHDLTGGLVLLVVAAGLLGYAIWRVVEAIADPDARGNDLKGLAVRAGFALRGLFHGALALAAFRVALGSRAASTGDQAGDLSALAFRTPGGELLVWAAAAGIIGYGLYQLYRSYASKLSRQLDLSRLSGQTYAGVVAVSRFGIGARGIVFCLIGYLVGTAAARQDAGQVGGVRESLGMLERLGQWPFAVVALGLIAYGVYEVVNARYRRIKVR